MEKLRKREEKSQKKRDKKKWKPEILLSWSFTWKDNEEHPTSIKIALM